MPNSQPWLKRPRLIGVIAGGIVLVLVAAAVVGLVVTQAAPEQPQAFRHSPHIQAGVQCLFCHSGAYRGVSATLPTRSKCLSCHNNMANDTPTLKEVASYLNKDENLEWVPVAIMPDFVYFSHRPHIAAGLNCETCHGNISAMDAAQPVKGQNMGWCLDCHKRLAPDKFVKLSDCETCHK